MPSKKLIIIGIICICALGAVVYAKVEENKPINAAHDDLIVQNISPTDALDVLKQKINTPPVITASTSVTSSISQEFAQKIQTLEQNGELNTDSEATLIEQMASTYATTSSNTLSLKDISTFSDLDIAKSHTFGNSTIKIIIAYYPILKTSPVDILSQAQEGSTTDQYPRQLAPIAKAYRSMALNLQKIPAPANVAADYLAVINGYILLGDDVDNMSAYFSDSVRGLIGVSNYQKDSANQLDLLKTIHNYFDTNGILFSTSDEGKVWSSI